jgi:rhodanese-related sulfurtransferase
MIARIELEELRRMMEEDAQVVEVLPRGSYDEAHLPGALSLPLGELDREGAGQLDRDRPVVLYCYDYQ